jgi:hypothetical protein
MAAISHPSRQGMDLGLSYQTIQNYELENKILLILIELKLYRGDGGS